MNNEIDDKAWIDSLLSDPKFQQSEEEDNRRRIEKAYRSLVQLRMKHLDFMKKQVVTVAVTRCEDCYGYEFNLRRKYGIEDDESWRPPTILARSWRRDLRSLGVTESEIKRAAKDEEFYLGCDKCNQFMEYGRDNIYVEEEPFELYFSELLPADHEAAKRSAPKWMKRIVYEAYQGSCFGCRRKLTWEEKSTDHVIPRSEGGLTELSNLQLLCRDCDGKRKGNHLPEEEHFFLYFLLIPS